MLVGVYVDVCIFLVNGLVFSRLFRLACDAGWLDLRVLFCDACDVGVVCGCEWVGVFAVCAGGVCIVVWLLCVCVCDVIYCC